MVYKIIVPASSVLLRCDDNMEACRKFLYFFLNGVGDGNAVHEIFQTFLCFVRKRFFATSQQYFYFYFVSFGKEFFRLIFFEFEIVSVGSEADSNTLCLNLLLFRFRLLHLFHLLVLEFSVIKDATYRRLGLRRDFYEIKFLFFCLC